jgi:hypothetical protein
MEVGRTSTNEIKIKTDSPLGLRVVNCACCGSECPTITSDYIVISKAKYDALYEGGIVSGSGGGSENTGCSFSGSVAGSVDFCTGDAIANGGVTCTIDGNPFESFIGIGWSIAKVGSEYRILYDGRGSCFSDIYDDNCYTVGFYISSAYDAAGSGGSFTQIGTGTIATSAGSISFGIYNLDFTATASFSITITPIP